MISIYEANDQARLICSNIFLPSIEGTDCTLITCTIVSKRQEIIIAIRNGRTKGETLYAFRNGSANYSRVLVSLFFFSLDVFLPFPFRKRSLSLFSFLSLFLIATELARSFNTLFERPRAGNWKFRASDPVRMFATAGLIRETCVQIVRKKKPETPVDRMNEHRSKQFYRSNLYRGTSTGKTIFKSH